MNGEIDKTAISSEEDRTLVEAFRGAQKDAFDKLVLKYKDRVFNLCYRFLGNYEEANDCAQDTFLKVYRSLGNFRFHSTFSTWLYRIAVNTSKNRLKSAEYRRRRKTVSLDNPGNPESGRHPLEIGDESSSPLSILQRKEKEMLIQKAIDSLPREQKTVVLLRDIEELPYEEIAGITGYNLGTVKSKLARAREKLREQLKESL